MTEEKREGRQGKLPEAFLARVQEGFGIPGFDRDAFLASCQAVPYMGLRLNTGKICGEDFPGRERLGKPVPWTDAGYYIEEKEGWSKNPYYYAGLYYIQEPSAMAPAEFLPVEPGVRVLDLCAAPGGKSTRLAERLLGEGFLLANDISASRAKALVKNLSLFGAGNIFVTAETPENLADAFEESFDRILVDAPCSGEGMFRRDPSLIRSWEERGPESYAPVQREILSRAVRMLAPGGYLLYSTCTFSEEENEANIRWIKKEYPGLLSVPLDQVRPLPEGFVKTDEGYRLFPHLLQGEGHFLSLLKRPGEGPVFAKERPDKKRTRLSENPGKGFGVLREFLNGTGMDVSRGTFYAKDTAWYYLPEGSEIKTGIRYLRTGLYLGEEKKGRFYPSQALAMRLSAGTFPNWVSFAWEDGRVLRYLKGETIEADGALQAGEDGWCLVCADGFALGFARREGKRLKNKYEVGWRWQ
ncbi:MAG: SAM-dependent methyltransferase [Lachnospiraceae bacterium]|nr:SAM-dependent methyltransferase [Lachnospiraceae bacterium]